MPKYNVEIREIEVYSIDVEAEDEDAAEHIAKELLEDQNERYKYHMDSDMEICTYNAEELQI